MINKTGKFAFSPKEMSLRESVQIRSFFWSVFFCIWTEYGDLRSKSPYSVRIHENMIYLTMINLITIFGQTAKL